MALNENIKKVILTPQDFLGVVPVVVPTYNSTSPYNPVRYRIISEDKTRASHWSPIFKVGTGTLPTVTSSALAFSGINNQISTAIFNWALSSSKFKSFDIFVEWSTDGGTTWTTPQYSGTSNSNNYSLPVPSQYLNKKIRLTLQVASIDGLSADTPSFDSGHGSPKVYSLRVFQTAATTIT